MAVSICYINSVFMLAATLQAFGGILWLMFSTAEKIIE